MKVAIVLIAALACAQAHSLYFYRESGWAPTTTPAPGWSSTEPPTTAGWSTEPPTTAGWSSTEAPTTAGWSTAPPTTQGWSQPTTSGWAAPHLPSNVNINLDAALSAAGSGWAAENHQDAVTVIGGGWTPAELSISSGGDSIVSQEGDITQVSDISGENASSVNTANVVNIVDAAENMGLVASGLEAIVAQGGWAAITGSGNLASAAESVLQANNKP